jgi:hypothetical protein
MFDGVTTFTIPNLTAITRSSSKLMAKPPRRASASPSKFDELVDAPRKPMGHVVPKDVKQLKKRMNRKQGGSGGR